MVKADNIDDYISFFPSVIKKKLREMRVTISKAAPKAIESMKYGMPTFEQQGNLVHFAAFKNHIGFYPAPDGITTFKKELAKYDQSKGTIRFAIDEALPLSLVSKIVKFRVKQNEEKAMQKARKKVIKKR